MPRLIEMMKQSAVPAGVMRSASRGALAVPPSEMLEILVYLSDHAIFGEQARMTLAGFDEAACTAALADPNTPREVLHYFLAPRNRRPKLLPVLLENPSVSEEILGAIAETANREVLTMLLASPRVMSSPKVLKPMVNNSHATFEEHEALTQKLGSLGVDVGAELSTVTDTHVLDWIKEHAAELEAEEREAKPFALMGGVDETAEESAEISAEALAAAKGKSSEQDERFSVLQKLAKLKVSERIKVAMTGTREERNILVRDSSKLVSSAVLASPKVSDQEIESFANMKNVRENVLRDIARNHKFMKNYVVIRNLCNNPRTPLDLSLGLIKNLLAPDLKILSMNKNIPETLRKMGSKLFKTRTSPGGRGAE